MVHLLGMDSWSNSKSRSSTSAIAHISSLLTCAVMVEAMFRRGILECTPSFRLVNENCGALFAQTSDLPYLLFVIMHNKKNTHDHKKKAMNTTRQMPMHKISSRCCSVTRARIRS